MPRCEECGRDVRRESPDGWVAYRVEDPDERDRTFVVVYCAECNAREFGPDGGR